MTYICSVERIGMERGLEKGLEQGIQQGMQQGIQQGMQQGLMRILGRQLTQRFGDVPGWATERLAKASVDELEAWAEAVLLADSLDAVFGESRH